ncbi:uncharacterized protein NEMAJ01_1055 [Nematocida major]|uniref:uncharacterized protein n=1 Tax=Nematocida major TaxID=1912982 RepID=UPI00200787EA|nr:uncharacterized protein NEMAJ01_1055 [Nematocida major]KAH9386159.1 hypothetical protein NEMAJ01_1055 [Nematocida major]
MKVKGWAAPEIVLKSPIGLGNISPQILKKTLQRGIEFNLLVVAEKGIGAKTLVSSIYNMSVFPQKTHGHSPDLTEHEMVMQSGDITLKLKIFMYRGKSASDVKDFLVERNTMYNKNNIGLRRERKEDPRIHASLFLVSPFEFKKQDIDILQVLSEHTNTLPVIPKRDIFTAQELEAYKERIRKQIASSGIIVCSLIPEGIDILSVVASTSLVNLGGQAVRGREYSWGVINAEDPVLSDLALITQILLSVHLIDLKKKTVRFYQTWKEAVRSELPCLEAQDKELLKEIEHTITGNFKAKLAALEMEDRKVDQAVKSLADPLVR